MIIEKSLIDSALRGWKSNVERADKLFGALSPDQLEQEVAPGRNRLIYLWGHLAGATVLAGFWTLLAARLFRRYGWQ